MSHLNSFLSDNFENFQLIRPIYYNWKFGLRFNLQNGKEYDEEYFSEVIKRASDLFESAFTTEDTILLVYIDYKYKRRKIRFHNYIFKQIINLDKNEVEYKKRKHKNLIDNIALIKVERGRIDYKNIFSVIANKDFDRNPSLDKLGTLSDKEVYFLNIDKKLIFYMYDDRGLDIISAQVETLKPIYAKFEKWILDYDRNEIENQFK